jgi:polyisoprenoid-binding protein YceI
MPAKSLPATLVLILTVIAVRPTPAEELLLVLDPEASEVSFGLETTLHHVDGSLHLDRGEIRFDLDTGAASGEVVIDAARAETGNDARDKKMHKSVLESALYPTITFEPQSISGEIGPDGRGNLTLEGQLSIHGDRHPLSLEADVTLEGGRATGETRFDIPYAEWGMKNPSLLLIRVAKDVQIELVAVGRLDPVAETAARVSH